MLSMLSSRGCQPIFYAVTAMVIVLMILLNPFDSASSWRSKAKILSDKVTTPFTGKRPSIAPPAWNRPPKHHVQEANPLLIGFTRNWPILKQAVVSYITAGWPSSDIYVIDNSTGMESNALGELSPQNPFYLNSSYLTDDLGINILATPTYLSFAQLQNFFLYTSITKHWPHYFWSHMDVVAVSDESYEPYVSLYQRAIDVIRNVTTTDVKWAIRFFAYDHLTLSNTAAYKAVGGFDTFIPFYQTDCDFYFRIREAGYSAFEVNVGRIYDVGESLPTLRLLARENTTDAMHTCTPTAIEDARKAGLIDTSTDPQVYGRGDCRYHALRRTLQDIDDRKQAHKGGRNFWQSNQTGGQGEPFWQYPPGFDEALLMQTESGKKVYEKKWAHTGCNLAKAGRTCKDSSTCSAWRVDEANNR